MANSQRQGKEDEVPGSRLFIVCGRGCSEDSIRAAFNRFGTITDLWFLKDKRTQKEKGVVFIKFSKASEAFLAVEEMNGRIVDGFPRALKVIIATQKPPESGERDPRDEDPNQRLFVVCPSRSFDDDELREEFEKYGELEFASVMKDKQTGQSKGYAFVKYHRAYHTALALENCDRRFKVRFADRKPNKRSNEDTGANDYSNFSKFQNAGSAMAAFRDAGQCLSSAASFGGGQQYLSSGQSFLAGGQSYPSSGQSEQASCCLSVLTSSRVSEDQITAILSLTPGFEYCKLDRTSGFAFVKYSNSQVAEHAQRKLDGLEFPLGYRMAARFADPSAERMGSGTDKLQEVERNLNELMQNTNNGNLQSLLQTIQQATSMLQNPGAPPSGGVMNPQSDAPYYSCSVNLPPKQPVLPKDTPMTKQVFFVLQWGQIPGAMLTDLFCRFGNLIEAYLVSGKNFGFAKFASEESAERALECLHLQTVDGQLIKVFEGNNEKYKERSIKRMRRSESDREEVEPY